MFSKTTGNLSETDFFPSSISIFLEFLLVFNIIGEENGLEIQGVSVFWLR